MANKQSNLGGCSVFAVSVLIGSGCQVSKSANPLSPSVAGPIAGSTISAPNLLEPGQDWQIHMRDQPVKLMFQNADTFGPAHAVLHA